MVIESRERLIKTLQREIDELRQENDELRKRMLPMVYISDEGARLSIGEFSVVGETKKELLDKLTKEIFDILSID